VLPSGFLNANRQPLRSHEEICIFYKKQPTYNPQKVKGQANHSKGTSQKNTNNNYGRFEIVDNREELGDMKHPRSIWSFQKPHPSKMVHPTEKSLECVECLIKTYTNEGDIVLDNTMGSGTTCLGALNTNRYYVGIEKDEQYFEIAVKKIEGVGKK
jgi:site-specific DNA-methyltransferase (adenine-specific)